MIIEISTNSFYGFYESLFSHSDEFLDVEMEDAAELQELTGNKNLQVTYEYENINKYKYDVTAKFMEIYYSEILNQLPDTIKDNKNFLFEPVPDSVEVVSPKYYNYTTDKPYLKVNTNLETLNLIKWYVLNLEGCSQYLIDNWSSRSGFISFISNDIKTWKRTSIKDYKETYFYVLFDMLLELSNPELLEKINLETYYNVEKYEYAAPVIELQDGQQLDYYKTINLLEAVKNE